MAKGSGSFGPYAQSLLRIVAGFTFSLHGFQKVFGYFGGMHGATAKLASLLGVAGILELLGGLLIILGLYTRPVAFLLCGEMAVAYFKQHFPNSIWPIANGGELAVLYCFIFLYLASDGAGPISLDRMVRKK